ncbi:MAG: N-acetylmuramoyl-L-alanine amidase [Bdellovibrionales bacterium]
MRLDSISLFLTILPTTLLPALSWSAPLVTIIDAGHGGRDHGAVRHNIQESDITLSVSQKLAHYLARDSRFRVSLTRTQNITLGLSERARMAKERNADVFVSIHVNSSPDPRAKGAEFYFQNQLPPDEESMYLAHKENAVENGERMREVPYAFVDGRTYPAEITTILTDLLDADRILRSSQLSKHLTLNWTGSRKRAGNSVRQAPFFVLSQMPVPSALVELGFLTNAHDFDLLTNSAAQDRMAHDLYKGLVRYKESIDKHTGSP